VWEKEMYGTFLLRQLVETLKVESNTEMDCMERCE
jgi:hypothetical protein